MKIWFALPERYFTVSMIFLSINLGSVNCIMYDPDLLKAEYYEYLV